MSQTKYPPIQIVNDRDEPIGGSDLSNAFQKGLIHRVVYIIVVDQYGKVLLQKRNPEMLTYPNCWDVSVGGHVDEGEDYIVAAKRELKEELGLDRDILVVLGSHYTELRIEDMWINRFVKVFKLTIDHDTPIHFARDEISEVRWMSIPDIKQLIKQYPNTVADGLIKALQMLHGEDKQ